MKPRNLMKWGSLLAGACALAISANGETLLYTLEGKANNNDFGYSLVALRDLDGDDVSDFAVGDPEFDAGGADGFSGSGKVLVISGWDGSIIFKLKGEPAENQRFGTSLGAIDANNDGKLDIVVGAPGGKGRVWIYSGADGSLIRRIATPSPGVGSDFGWAVVNAGDQNGDGIDDLFVGAPGTNSNDGRVAVISGADGSLIVNLNPSAPDGEFGSSIARVSDLNGNGKRDLAVGSPGFKNDLGKVQLIASNSGTQLAQRVGTVAGARLGTTVASVGDRNGDNNQDVVAGTGSGGGAFLLSGSNLSILANFSKDGSELGQPVVSGGAMDVDNDGDTELLLGYPGANPFARVVIRPAPGGEVSGVFEADTDGSELGFSVIAVPGLGFVIGDPGVNGGAVHVYSTLKDNDADGIPNILDECDNSILTNNVRFGDVNSGVENRLDDDGCSLADLFADLKLNGGWSSHQEFVDAARKLINQLNLEQVITDTEGEMLLNAAKQSNIGNN